MDHPRRCCERDGEREQNTTDFLPADATALLGKSQPVLLRFCRAHSRLACKVRRDDPATTRNVSRSNCQKTASFPARRFIPETMATALFGGRESRHENTAFSSSCCFFHIDVAHKTCIHLRGDAEQFLLEGPGHLSAGHHTQHGRPLLSGQPSCGFISA